MAQSIIIISVIIVVIIIVIVIIIIIGRLPECALIDGTSNASNRVGGVLAGGALLNPFCSDLVMMMMMTMSMMVMMMSLRMMMMVEPF